MKLNELEVRRNALERMVYLLKSALEIAEKELKAIDKEIDSILYPKRNEEKTK